MVPQRQKLGYILTVSCKNAVYFKVRGIKIDATVHIYCIFRKGADS